MGSDDGGALTGGVGVSVSDWENWASLGKFVEILGVRDVGLEIKADILRHLCYFLSSSAATFKYPSVTPAEDIGLSAVVRDREVNVNYDDLVALHDLLFRELAHHIPLFSAGNEKLAEIHSAFPSSLQELKVAALTLRCCIRLLPLIELFDTGLRNAMGVDLVNLLRKICSPWEPCLLRTKICSSGGITPNIEPYRAPTLCASLEVFVDELLCRSKTQLVLVQDGSSEKGTRSTARFILEATLAHVMISAHAPKELHEPRARACELSLQSAVILLDRVITDNAPRYLLAHVVRIVSQALEDSMCTAGKFYSAAELNHEKKWFSRFLISGYSNNTGSCKVDTNYMPESLSRQVCLWLVSSVLERGVSLYLKFASAPHLANFVGSVNNGPQLSAAVSSTLLASCLWNYMCHRSRMSQECEAALESMLNDATLRKGLEECMDQTCYHDHGHIQGHEPGQDTHCVLKAVFSNGNIERSSGTHFCGRELGVLPVWEEDHSTLIADVLHVMHSALNFITETTRSIEQDSLAADMAREDFDDVWLGLIGSFHQCLPSAGEITAADSVGHVLVFFTDMLYYEAETSISDNKLREYLELLESLLIALLMEYTWRKSTSLPQLFDHTCGKNRTVDVESCRGGENESISPSCYARKVVSLLQGFLEEPDLPEILGGNAVSIILQINCFLNDFCEFMDKVLSTSDWRDYIPANGRRFSRKIPKTMQEVVLLDRNIGEENFDHDMPLWDGHLSPDDERGPAEHQPCPSNAGRQQGQDRESEPAEHQPCPSNAGRQQGQDEESEPPEHDLCPTNIRVDKQQLRPSTLPILQRLLKHRRRQANPRDVSPERNPVSEPEGVTRTPRPVRKCRQVSEDETSDIPTEAEGNQFVAEVLLLEKTSENFDDLNDFIVCKQGRSYTRWLNRRTKFRRRKRTREIWKRSEEKQKLLSMLNIV
ncbi:hypothetical protein M758_10G061200 [Ceratodon purpureus]|nr:hypothetical protein M758_10G061200 [Ceratodon purpureus]